MDDIRTTLQVGAVVGPERHRFRLQSELRSHPYGMLWKAEDLASSGRPEVTLLFLPEVLCRQPEFVERLRKWVILSRKCKHPHALDCYGLFSFKGSAFLAFEPLDGLTLADMLQQGQTSKLKPEQKQGLLIQSGKAIDAFHRETRKDHASLSPELIFISTGRGVRVMMIGWCHLLEDYLDLMQDPPGYPQYQAPEGFDPQPTSIRSDVYAFAAIIYHLYAGKPAFSPQDDEKARYQRELKAPAGLDARQWQHLQQALSPDQQARPSGILELLKQLYLEQAAEAETELATSSEPTLDDVSPHPSGRSVFAFQQRLAPWLASPRLHWLHRIPFRRLILPGVFFVGLLTGLLLSIPLRPDISAYETERLRLLAEIEALNSPVTNQTLTHTDPAEDVLVDPFSEHNAEESPESTPTDERLAITAAQHTERETLEGDNSLMRFRDHFGDAGFAPLMQALPPGEFLMGDLNRMGDDNERPVRTITFDYAFALSVHEVTFAEYDQFAIATGRPLPDDEGWGREQRPVINVSWEDASDYTRWLADVTGEPYRLPTEAEWEYTARAGTISAWWWGNELIPAMAVCDGCGTQWDGQQTAPVGQLPANPWGFMDMHGNVDEWVQDCYSDHYSQAPEDGSAVLSGDCQLRVMRGGSWFDIPRVIRSSSRYRHTIDSRRNTWGFRVAVDLPDGH